MQSTQATQAPLEVNTPTTTQTTKMVPVVHVAQPDVYLVQKSDDNFWNTQATPLAAILSVLLTIVAKWIWDVRAEKRELKRKLYLELVDAITEGTVVLASFADPNISFQSLAERYAKAASVMTKTEVVAANKMLKALADLNIELGKAIQEATRTRILMEKFRVDIDTNDPIIRRHDTDLEAIIAEQKRMNIDNVKDQERFDRLQRQYNFSQHQRDELVKQNATALTSFSAVVAELADISLRKHVVLLPLVERLKQLMRNDLGFRYDYEENLKRKVEMAHLAQEEYSKSRQAVFEAFMPDSKKSPGAKEHE
jgi:hypothetical protein